VPDHGHERWQGAIVMYGARAAVSLRLGVLKAYSSSGLFVMPMRPLAARIPAHPSRHAGMEKITVWTAPGRLGSLSLSYLRLVPSDCS
jgi:hypothetical protein